MPASTPSGIIHQADFDTYSTNWVEIVSHNANNELAKCFRLAGADQNINCVYFSALQIAQLVSTVGAQNIKARFLAVRTDDGYPHFALALFATDDLNGRLSAYYISQIYWEMATVEDETDEMPQEEVPPLDVFTPVLLPDALAAYWQANWSPEGADPDATQAMFDSTYGYLRGYTFQLDDFLKPLVQIPAGISIADADPIRINFGLHEYYPATVNVDTPRSTFGLMVSYVCAPRDSRSARAAVADVQDANNEEVFYDLGSPCPPMC